MNKTSQMISIAAACVGWQEFLTWHPADHRERLYSRPAGIRPGPLTSPSTELSWSLRKTPVFWCHVPQSPSQTPTSSSTHATTGNPDHASLPAETGERENKWLTACFWMGEAFARLTWQRELQSCISCVFVLVCSSSFVTLKDWIVSWRGFLNCKHETHVSRRCESDVTLACEMLSYFRRKWLPRLQQMIQQQTEQRKMC